MGLFSNKSNGTGEMSFLGHLEALRWHLFRSAIAVVTFALVLFFFKEFLFDTVLLAPKQPDFITYRILCAWGNKLGLGEDLCVTVIPFTLISTDLSAQFTTHMWVAFIAGVVLSSLSTRSARASSASSPPRTPASCSPTGSPSSAVPQGTVTAG